MKMELLQRQAALSPHASAYSSLVRSAAVLMILLYSFGPDAKRLPTDWCPAIPRMSQDASGGAATQLLHTEFSCMSDTCTPCLRPRTTAAALCLVPAVQANTPLALQMQHNDAFSSGGPTPRSNWSPQADRLQHLARHNTQLQVADAPHLRRMFCRVVRGGLPSSCAAWQIMHCG